MVPVPVVDSGALFREFARFARERGWELVEWDWKDIDEDGTRKYEVWVQPVKEEAKSA